MIGYILLVYLAIKLEMPIWFLLLGVFGLSLSIVNFLGKFAIGFREEMEKQDYE